MTALWLAFRSQMDLIGLSCHVEIDKIQINKVSR